ncbi:MAG: DNA alkylation repair protein [Lachnospiraceae bacterium]|nr:DNA alkylation repair protein [Lachnospiraceae bacterium]
MNTEEIREKLFSLRDEKYRELQKKIIPNIPGDRVIGVRTPILRNLAKELYKDEDVNSFLSDLPHKYFDEDQLHAFIISLEKDFDTCISEVKAFLPYIDNWATCDQMSPKVFKKNSKDLLPYVNEWIDSDKTYTVRFAIGMLMQHFLDEKFDTKYADMVAEVRSEEYYINMMAAWYFATALAKQYDQVIPYIEENRLSDWVHNKTIRKSVESYRISDEKKAYLRSLRRKKG